MVKFQLHIIIGQEGLVLLNQGIFRFGQNADQVLFCQLVEGRKDRQAANQLWNDAKFLDIISNNMLHVGIFLSNGCVIVTKTDDFFTQALLNDFFDAVKGPTYNKEDVLGIDMNHFLLGMLTPALWWNAGHCSLDNFQEGLLNPFTRYVTGNGDILPFFGNLINLIHVDDTTLGPVNVEIRRLKELEQDIFYIFSHIAGLSQGCRISDGKGDIEALGQGLSQEGLARASWANHQDIGLLDIHIVLTPCILEIDALVVIVYCYRQGAFGPILADDIMVENIEQFLRLWRVRQVCQDLFCQFFSDNFLGQFDTLITDENIVSCDDFLYFFLIFTAK